MAKGWDGHMLNKMTYIENGKRIVRNFGRDGEMMDFVYDCLKTWGGATQVIRWNKNPGKGCQWTAIHEPKDFPRM